MNGQNGNADRLDPSKLIEKSNATASSSLLSLTSVSSAIPQTDESVILITSPYTNGLTVPAIMNPNATNSACLLTMPASNPNLANGSSGLGEVSCSSMTSPPITPPQTGTTSTTYLPSTQINSSLSITGVTQPHAKDISIPTSSKMMLPSLQTASVVSPIQGSNYFYVPSSTMQYSSPLGIPISSSTKTSSVMNQYSNTTIPQTFQSPANQFINKANAATTPTVMSPPMTPFLDPNLMCIPTANATFNDPTNHAFNQVFSPMFGSSGQSVSSALPPPSLIPVIPGVSSGLDFSNGSSLYPNQFLVSNDPGSIQYLNVKNSDGYLSPGNSPSPFAYPPGNYPSPSAVHVTTDRSVYSTTLSDVSLLLKAKNVLQYKTLKKSENEATNPVELLCSHNNFQMKVN